MSTRRRPVPRVLIADDHPATRAGIRMVLEADGFAVVAEESTGPGAVEAALRERPELCLLDIRMPGDGLTAAAEISAELPATAIVMLTVSDDENDLLAALRAGASGYLPKGMDARRLPDALRGVLRGEAAIPRSLVTRVVAELQERPRRRRSPVLDALGVELSDREWDVLELMRKGTGTREIGRSLSISPVTVRRHVSGIVRKLGASSREAALELLDEHVHA